MPLFYVVHLNIIVDTVIPFLESLHDEQFPKNSIYLQFKSFKSFATL